mgnify:CR=1 FL=1
MCNMMVVASLTIVFIVCLINNYLKNKIIKGYMHSLNQSETRFVRERRLKEEFYDRYKSLKNQWDKLPMDEEE